MRTNKSVIVIEAIDLYHDSTIACYQSLVDNINGSDVAVASYGGAETPDQPITAAWADQNGLDYYDAPRHSFLPKVFSEALHCYDFISRMSIVRHFSLMGYEEVFTIHNDAFAQNDFRDKYRVAATGKWSFVSAFLRPNGMLLEECARAGGWVLKGRLPRLASIVLLTNPDYAMELFGVYGDEQGIWRDYMCKFPPWGDLTMFDLFNDWHGYGGRAIEQKGLEQSIRHGSGMQTTNRPEAEGLDIAKITAAQAVLKDYIAST